MAKCVHGRSLSFKVSKRNYDVAFTSIIEGACPKCGVRLSGKLCFCCGGYFAAEQTESTDSETGRRHISHVIDIRPESGV